jgi:hypothetical protein
LRPPALLSCRLQSIGGFGRPQLSLVSDDIHDRLARDIARQFGAPVSLE